MTTKEELEICYKYYLHMKDGNVKNVIDGFNMRFYDGWFSPNETFFGFMLALREFNGFPRIVKDDVFDKIDEKIYYHGYKDYDHGAEMLSQRIYNLGTGTCTPGMYFTDEKSTAKMYTNNDFLVDGDIVLPVKCVGNKMPKNTRQALNFMYCRSHNFVKFIENKDDQEKIMLLQEFCKNLKGEDKKKFYDLFRSNIGTMCAYLGYDYMSDGYSYIVVTNRGKLIVPESEAKRFFDNSTKYKDILGAEVLVEENFDDGLQR